MFSTACKMFVTVLCCLKVGTILHGIVQMQEVERPFKEPICSEFRLESLEKGVIKVTGHPMAMSHEQNMTIKIPKYHQQRKTFLSLCTVVIKPPLCSSELCYRETCY